jgi:trk system potassium uptake protein TrkA
MMVIGLGRFGSSTAESLVSLGHEVLAVDHDARLVQQYSTRLTHVVEADATREDVLRQLGAAEFGWAIVGIGAVEQSVLCVAILSDLGVKEIWAKALTPEHGRILERVGAHHVIHPESAMGERVAHLVTGKMIDFIEFDDGFAIVKMRPPQETIGFTLAQSQVRSKYGVTVVGVKSPGQDFTYAQADTKVSAHDTLIVRGPTDLLERLASRP